MFTRDIDRTVQVDADRFVRRIVGRHLVDAQLFETVDTTQNWPDEGPPRDVRVDFDAPSVACGRGAADLRVQAPDVVLFTRLRMGPRDRAPVHELEFQGIVPDMRVDLVIATLTLDSESGIQGPSVRCSVLLRATGTARGDRRGRKKSPRPPSEVVREAADEAVQTLVDTWKKGLSSDP